MPRKASRLWLDTLIHTFSPEELSRGTRIEKPVYNRKTQTYSIKPSPMRGTRMTSRKLDQIVSGMRSPSKTDLKKLRTFYDRFSYNTLRGSGASPKQARRIFRSPPQALSRHIFKYKRASKVLAEARDTSQAAIQHSLAKSSIAPQDLRRRIILSGLKDWRGVLSESEINNLVDEYMRAGFLAELDTDEDE